ncbi:MAG TPA: NAD-dependent epimerase/dehydratase family protein, partial [Bryobacteraceae bacterium]|nr:NAD-dependent epimerase/dehydratase family protein [Bryobacteraceae bacterium]
MPPDPFGRAPAPQPALPRFDLEQVLAASEVPWEDLRGRRLFMTGATGFFGRWMLESLLAANQRFGLQAEVIALSRDPERFWRIAPHLALQRGLTWMRGSVAALAPEALRDSRCDFALHLATEADLAATTANPAASLEVIAGGTRRALAAAAAAGARRFLFASSGIAYGRQPSGMERTPEGVLGEAGPAAPSDRGYLIGGEAKRRAELACAEYSRGDFVPVVARCFTFAGPAQPLAGKFAFGNFLADALAGRTVVVEGDGTPVRSYLYAADLAIWLWTLLLRGRSGRPYNVGAEEALS